MASSSRPTVGPAPRSADLTLMRRQVVRRLAARGEQLSSTLVSALRAEIDAYGASEPQLLADDEVHEAGRRHVRIALAGLEDGGRLTPASRVRLEQLARERAGQGIALHALVRACQVCARELWQALLEVVPEVAPDDATRADLLADLSRSALQLTSEIAATASAAYVETGRHRLADQVRVRDEVLEQLLGGSAPATGPLQRRAASIGFRPAAWHVVAVVAASEGFAGGSDDQHARFGGALAAAAPGEAPLVGVHAGTHVAIYPVRGSAAEHDVRQALERSLATLGSAASGHHAAVGRAEPGLGGVTVSYRQAVTTLELARDCGLVDRTLSYVRSLPWLLLSVDTTIARDLQRTTIEPLRAHDRDRGSDLVATCRALLEVQGNRAEAAKRLHVHRHTLATRMRRIEQLTGRSFDDRDDVLLLELGLRADELVGSGGDLDTDA